MTSREPDDDDDRERWDQRPRVRRDLLHVGRESLHPRDLDRDEDRGRSGPTRPGARDDRDRGEDRDRDGGRRRREEREDADEGTVRPRDGAGRPRGDRDGRPSDDRDRSRADKAGGTAGEAKPEASRGDGSKAAGGKDGEEAQGRRKGRRPVVIAVAAVVALLLIAGGAYYYLSSRGKASTDDAFTDGNVVAIAAQVSGQVASLDVIDNQFVHKGDPLIHIDARQFLYAQEQSKGALDANKAQVANQRLGVEIARKNFPASLQLAQASLISAKANLVLQQANYERQKGLPRQATTQQEVDASLANYQQAQAQVEQAQARVVQAEPVQQNIGQSEAQINQLAGQGAQTQGQLEQANLNVEWSVVRAPQDGWVTRRNVNAGNYVSAGTQIMALVTTDLWITANFKETELDGMRPGQSVRVAVDAYPDLDLRGHVESIQHGSGSRFSAFPAENATGNFVKIVQRVPVKIVIDAGLNPQEPLPLGASVVPTVMLK